MCFLKCTFSHVWALFFVSLEVFGCTLSLRKHWFTKTALTSTSVQTRHRLQFGAKTCMFSTASAKTLSVSKHQTRWSVAKLTCVMKFTGCRPCGRPPKSDDLMFWWISIGNGGFGLDLGGLVHPQSGLLCGAALPEALFFQEKHDFSKNILLNKCWRFFISNNRITY